MLKLASNRAAGRWRILLVAIIDVTGSGGLPLNSLIGKQGAPRRTQHRIITDSVTLNPRLVPSGRIRTVQTEQYYTY